jgi:hypothetical protein
MLLGIATLMAAVPIDLGIAHQAGAALTLGGGDVLAWTARGAQWRKRSRVRDRERHAWRVDVDEQGLAVGEKQTPGQLAFPVVALRPDRVDLSRGRDALEMIDRIVRVLVLADE